MALYYAILIALIHLHKRFVPALLLCVLVPLSALQAYADYRERFNTDLGIFFIDVGQGNAALIEGPGGFRALVDGGGFPDPDFDMGRQVITPFLLYRKIRTVDYVINTHPHADHIGGLAYVMRNFNVSRLVAGGLYPLERKSRDLIEAARSRGVQCLVWKKGDAITTGAFTIDVLHPDGPVLWDDPNNSALVLKIRYGQTSFLLPADIGSDVEKWMVATGLPLRSDVLDWPASRQRQFEQLCVHCRSQADARSSQRPPRPDTPPAEPCAQPVQGPFDTRLADGHAGLRRGPYRRPPHHVADVRGEMVKAEEYDRGKRKEAHPTG